MRWKLTIYIIATIIILLLVVFLWQVTAPRDFPQGIIYNIPTGTGLNYLSRDLYNKNIIRSPFLFKIFSVISGGTKGILAGDYDLEKNESVYNLAIRMTSADYRLMRVKFTIPEGYNIYEVAKTVSTRLPEITEADFISKAINFEGYLFPDTYFFYINTDTNKVIQTMRDNFDKKIASINDQVINSGISFDDILKMASILEEEARTNESRKIISGILWKRISLGIPLQVDASFKYINGKGTKDLTLDDLKIDSPYNSYLYKGLPPTPISNPGLNSILAAINPIKTDYLFFLTDDEGEMHYAVTFAKHLQNKELYLK